MPAACRNSGEGVSCGRVLDPLREERTSINHPAGEESSLRFVRPPMRQPITAGKVPTSDRSPRRGRGVPGQYPQGNAADASWRAATDITSTTAITTLKVDLSDIHECAIQQEYTSCHYSLGSHNSVVGADQGLRAPSWGLRCRVLWWFLALLARLAVRSGRSKELEIIVAQHDHPRVRPSCELRTREHPGAVGRLGEDAAAVRGTQAPDGPAAAHARWPRGLTHDCRLIGAARSWSPPRRR